VEAIKPDSYVGFKSKLTVTAMTNSTAGIIESSRNKSLKQSPKVHKRLKPRLFDKINLQNRIVITRAGLTTPCPEKKGATLFLPVSLRNANRFSKFFHHHTLQ